ncbi:hypothetical protein M3Y97_00932200 [Aphelenchoides bicaudatus]|nr:hypothetical protein M3Y97_00932200 [Aphelenchoides bicaudatus]
MSRPKQRTPQSLLALMDGGYQRNNECECPSKEHIRSTKITYSKFRLTPVCCKPYCLCCGVVLTLLVIALVVISAFSLLPLAVSIPVGIIALLCAVCGFFSFANVDKNQHGHVVVDFKCYQCNHEYKMLYDCITLEKRARRGYYRKDCTLLDRSTTERTYEFVENAYEEMRDGLDKCYCPGSYTCNTWADDFYAKIR